MTTKETRLPVVNTGNKLADYWANSASSCIQRDVKSGRVKKVTVSAAKLIRTQTPVGR